MRIEPVTSQNIEKAAYVHSVSWKESHKSFCSESFVAEHTAERQKKYIEQKMNNGAEFFVLFDKEAKGVVSVSGCMIEDLYVLPTEQRKGYGTILLRYAEQKMILFYGF
ncbi:MAG: GNAT family N-acetyltransferase [Christensenellaceae bacterium]|nr:GNAT family N-acetyltransferase [Christensenellaceae bacterium]